MKDKTLSSNYSFKGTIWLFMLVLSSFMYVANAQQRNVQGMVTDPNGEPIIGASVVVKGTTNGTITDFDGKFTLSNVPEKGIITITYIGYKGQDIPVAGKSTLKVTLAEDTETLDEVVVVGYGTQKKSDVTGSMVSVGAKELKSRPMYLKPCKVKPLVWIYAPVTVREKLEIYLSVVPALCLLPVSLSML